MTSTTRESIGLVAGRGRYPLLFCEAAKRHGVRKLVVVAMKDETDPVVEKLADEVEWVRIGALNAAIQALRKRGVSEVVFAGQIKPGRLFGGMWPDLRAMRLLGSLALKNAESIFGALAAEFEKDGIRVLPATTYLEEFLAGEGVLGRRKPKKSVLADLELGWQVAREVSRLDVGQTVVVKKGTVLAVEGFEGTDAAIKRGGELGRGDVTVFKVAKPNQDMRFDVPCIGLRTVESLAAAGAIALGVQAGKTLFIDRDEVLAALDDRKIAIVGRGAEEP